MDVSQPDAYTFLLCHSITELLNHSMQISHETINDFEHNNKCNFWSGLRLTLLYDSVHLMFTWLDNVAE